jgi:hypothetical protein
MATQAQRLYGRSPRIGVSPVKRPTASTTPASTVTTPAGLVKPLVVQFAAPQPVRRTVPLTLTSADIEAVSRYGHQVPRFHHQQVSPKPAGRFVRAVFQ